jgi:hypothetical protein
MPVVLVEVGGRARSGHLYGDRTGIDYEYPARRYQRMIQTGERFVYQKPGVGYFGCGVIGEIYPSEEPGLLVCDILSMRRFESPVPLKSDDGRYYEADPTFWKDRVYWGQGVRPLSEVTLEEILTRAGVLMGEPDPLAASYANPRTARDVENYSVGVAVAEVAARFGESPAVMPHNNPGFDLRLGSGAQPSRYFEVKGTQAMNPVFFMSDGEREFSFRNRTLYTLIVVAGIDVAAATHTSVIFRDGAVEGDGVTLRPNQWRGALHVPRVDLTWPTA